MIIGIQCESLVLDGLGKTPGAALKEAIEHQFAKADANPEPKTYRETEETEETKEPKNQRTKESKNQSNALKSF
ncbi:hypothetical protein CXB42_23280 [Pseudomonas syringae pv. syringae]|uniref:Uncharacterized protein n=1 Tax=Pseudomonas syringae pv. syringae TaxID=321 RepID=A0AAE5S471_PSESY|nr:hypothetical protein CXB42_23280 [Pseudomonas syringae pv. syringae]